MAAILVAPNAIQAETAFNRHRIFIVSSYDRDYLWSQSTHRGVVAAMRQHGYLESTEQAESFAAADYLESPRVVLKKSWMNTKRYNSTKDIATATLRIVKEIEDFHPDLVLLGDDNAANYIGNQLLDTDIPVVFWGINGLPLKYGLIDSMERPGHNITGVWQTGYYRESLELLHRLVPMAKTFAVLACDSVTARPKVKQIVALANSGNLPLTLSAVVQTNSYEEFRKRTLELAESVDAFFVLNHDTLRNGQGDHVDMLDVGRWYLTNIRKPEASHEDQFVREGMLLAANDSGYNQGYAAFEMAHKILAHGYSPALMRPESPPRGPYMVNRRRAEMLGIDLKGKMEFIDEIVEQALALGR
ncbi:MAG: hypothetical protein KDI63_07810 [Gammaproteobacteria bacterium]|nr:hypothetical protein [Gammaproteobacteria bacterium]